MRVGATPDEYQGYGRIDLLNILPLTDSATSSFTLFVHESSLKQLEGHNFVVTVAAGTVPFKITLSWYDPPNEHMVAKCLLHDLDLVVVDPTGRVFYGNAHTTVIGSLRDEINNNEQIQFAKPATGNWEVHVQSKLLSEFPSQNYSLVITANGQVVRDALTSFSLTFNLFSSIFYQASSITQSAIDPSFLNKCHPSSGEQNSLISRMELNLELYSRVKGGGWGAADKYSITSNTSNAILYTGSFPASHSTVLYHVYLS